jgi:hypothetical protein
VDLVAELDSQRIVALEVKAGFGPDEIRRKAPSLAMRRARWSARGTVVLHTGAHVYELDDQALAVPIAAI